MTKPEIIAAAKTLSVHELSRILDEKEDVIGKVIWTPDDIACQLKEDGYPPTKENIKAVKEILKTDYDLNDCSSGWFVIESAVYDADKNKELQKKAKKGE